jgi:hypothetical protein
VTGVEVGAGEEVFTGAAVDTGAGSLTGVVAVVVVDVELEPAPDDVLTGDEVGLETGNRVEVPKPRLAPPGTMPEPQPVTVKARVSNASLGRVPGMHYSLELYKKSAKNIKVSF